jgi:hypothetical protein
MERSSRRTILQCLEFSPDLEFLLQLQYEPQEEFA